jgi:pyruvate/2-oxoacid:ferredoxin oxidoreductase alpha subunit
MKKVLKGNAAVAEGARLARAQVIAAYPITPQTTIIEELASMCSDGRLNATYIPVESEHSAMAACIAASLAGARAFTATSAQGLALMHELLHWAAGARAPVVLANVNRAMAPSWSIWTDQSDSLSQRDTGFMQVYCDSAQEVLDSVVLSFKVSEKVLMPTMTVLDAFFLSHTAEIVEVPDQETVDKFLPPLELPHKLDVTKPAALFNMTFPDKYMEHRRKMAYAQEAALEVWEDVGREWRELTGRGFGLMDAYRMEDAELVLVACGTVASTAHAAIDTLRDEGIRAGLARIRVFRPFPTRALQFLLANRRRVVVFDRNFSYGHHGIFHEEIKSALYDLPHSAQPHLRGVVGGLGGRDITVDDLVEMLTNGWRDELREPVTWWDVLPASGPPLVAAM